MTSWNVYNDTGCCQQQIFKCYRLVKNKDDVTTYHNLSVAGGGAGGDCLRSSQFQESGAAVSTCLPATNTLFDFSPLCAFQETGSAVEATCLPATQPTVLSGHQLAAG